MKVLISKKTGKYYYYNGSEDYHCKEGLIKKEELESGRSTVISNTEREFYIFEANLYDRSRKITRGPQLITEKDLGYIVARSRMNKDSIVVEAGAGSGAATAFFASIAKEVHSYEIREDHAKIVEKNLNLLNLNNVKLTVGDLLEEIKNEKEIDLLFLDMPDPQEVLNSDLSGVKSGAYIVCYVPSISQIQEITKVAGEKEDLYFEEISEVILRHWRVWERVSRPEHRKEIDHTAFLVFIRKI
ncbi:MAG: methyltransferase domain-containing protein [Nanoarchaeota archaeon]|nr:methyltransferase domain-containing protein [Nanoarchaeota archaeon]